jgi:UDP-N-acetylmuramoyl-tripeptide--D-alanyl-D-alanine ligase
MRGALLRMKGGIRLLDETYNSNPRAMERTLDTLARMRAERKVVAAGDMRELGSAESEAHRAMGEQVAHSGAALFIAVGSLSRLAAETARASGVPEVRHFPDSETAAAWTAAALRPGDLVLVKGSRGMAMERIVEAIRSSLGMEDA